MTEDIKITEILLELTEWYCFKTTFLWFDIARFNFSTNLLKWALNSKFPCCEISDFRYIFFKTALFLKNTEHQSKSLIS